MDGSGDGKGKGKAARKIPVAVRHRHGSGMAGKKRDVPARPALRRIARRAGVKRLTESSHPAIRAALIEFLERIEGDAVTMTEYRRANTVSVDDVVYSLRHNNVPLYGAGVVEHTHRRRGGGGGAAAAAAVATAVAPGGGGAAADAHGDSEDESAGSGGGDQE